MAYFVDSIRANLIERSGGQSMAGRWLQRLLHPEDCQRLRVRMKGCASRLKN